jgi:hypothetical protein
MVSEPVRPATWGSLRLSLTFLNVAISVMNMGDSCYVCGRFLS